MPMLPVPVEQVAKSTQDRAFTFAATATFGCGLQHPSRQPGKGQGLEPDLTGATEGGEEEPLTSKQGRLDASYLLDIEADLAFESHHAAGIDMDCLTGRELTFYHAAAGMHEDEAVPLQFLHDEAFSAEESGKNLLLEVNADLDPLGGREETIFLADQPPAYARQIDVRSMGMMLPG